MSAADGDGVSSDAISAQTEAGSLQFQAIENGAWPAGDCWNQDKFDKFVANLKAFLDSKLGRYLFSHIQGGSGFSGTVIIDIGPNAQQNGNFPGGVWTEPTFQADPGIGGGQYISAITIHINTDVLEKLRLAGANGGLINATVLSAIANELGDVARFLNRRLPLSILDWILGTNQNPYFGQDWTQDSNERAKEDNYSIGIENEWRKIIGEPPRAYNEAGYDLADHAIHCTMDDNEKIIKDPHWDINIKFTGGSRPHYDPLVLNLTANSAPETTSMDGGTQFDVQNNGFAEQTTWITPKSGFLVYDPSSAVITNGSQMFGTSWSLSGGGYAVDGFQALADLDSNSDGVINSSDTHWSDLRVWVDANSNGATDSGELETMSAAGIASISLTTTNTDVTDGNGNYIGKTATYSLVGGGSREIADITFQTDPALSTASTMVSVDGTVSLLPELQGYGVVTGLQQATQIQKNASDTTLQGYLQDFVSATDDAARNTLVDEILYQWAGVSGVSPTARGSYFDARQLESLENFSGEAYTDPFNSTSDPSQDSAPYLEAAYGELHSQVLAGLEKQTNLASLFNDVPFIYDEDNNISYWYFGTAETDILSQLSANRSEGLATLADFNQALHEFGMDSGFGYDTFRSDLVAQGDDLAATFLDGTPIVYGTLGNDVITAWTGNQTIIAGQGGDDTLIGSGDNETFFGSGGSNLFIGGIGNNEVFWGGSTGGRDTFIAGQGTEFFRAGMWSQATASYASGDGDLTILAEGDRGETNSLVLDSSISRSDLSWSVSAFGVTITDGTAGDQISVAAGFDTLELADGTTINLKRTGGSHATSANATVSGNGTNDIYSYDPGTGTVTLSDTGGTNELWMGGTLTASNISLTTSGNDLLIADGVGGDSIKDLNRAVQEIRFSDGSTLDLLGAGSTYTLSGGTTSTGTALNDTYVFASGTGTATISDPGGSNTLSFGTGILSSSLAFTASGTDLLITDGVSGDKVIIQGQLSGREVVSSGTFSGGASLALTGLNLSEASGGSSLNGTTGNDTLNGASGTQTLSGNGGNDIFINASGNTTAVGGDGSDTYSYASGSGLLTISESGGSNTIVLGSGISTGSVSLIASGNDLKITDGVSGDTITITGQLDAHVKVDSLVFNGGTTWALQGVALTMPGGSTVLNGTPGDDTLTATSGTETLIGNSGNDTFVGSSGTESLMGNGFSGNNLFVVGTGVTTAYGGSGDDTYSYASGSGLLTVNEEGGNDTIALGSGLSSVTLAASGHDLVLTDGVSGDTITLKNQLTTTQGVEMLTYTGGGSLALDGIALTANASTLYGTAGNDTLTAASSSTETLTGNGGDDIFIDATGSHTFAGGTGADTFSYHSGDGLLTITETGGINTVKLGSGISTASVTTTESGHDLLITDGVGGDTITLKNQMSANLVITDLVFNDGTTWLLDGMALTASGSTLYGTEGDDTLTATTGTQTLIGNGGSDTFVGATGAVRMTGTSGNDSFMGGTGSETMTGGGGNDYFHNGGGTDTMTGSSGNETFVGGSGVASMVGNGGNDTFIAGGGTAIVSIANGDNIYSFGSGNGQFTITDTAGTDTLYLGSGLTSANVSLSEASNGHDLLILDGTGSDQIDVVGHITGSAIETLVYGDASTLNLTTSLKITAASGTSTLTGTTGNDTLYGSTGTQTLNGNGGTDTFIGGTGTQTLNGSSGANNVFIDGSGNQTALGGGGNDTFSYAASDGSFYISDSSGGTDTLKLASGLTSSNVSLSESADGQDLWILDGTGGDKITIKNEVPSTVTSYRVEKLIYGDGSTLSLTGTGLTLLAQTGSSTLTAFNSGNNTLIAVSGAATETLVGNTGNDTYSYASGTGIVVINENGNGGTDTLKLGSGLTSANVVFSESTNGNDFIVTDGVAGDTITLKNAVKSVSSEIEKIVYGDGSTADLSGIELVAGAGNTSLNGTTGNDILVGTTGNQTINGKGGSDVFNAGTGTQTLIGTTTPLGNNTFFTGSGSVSALGGTGSDTYHFASGAGAMYVSDSGGTDTLVLDDLNAGAVTLSGSGLDLLITDGVGGDQIDVANELNASGSGHWIENLIYSNGSTLNLLSGNLTIYLATGNSTLGGTHLSGADTYIATTGSGTESVKGGDGNETYSYDSGDGMLWISEASSSGSTADLVKLGSGLTSSNVSFSETSDGIDLLILDGTGGDQIDIDHFRSAVAQIETLQYGDGSTLAIMTGGLKITAASGTSSINGTTGNDTLIGTSGTQKLIGNGGNDTFIAGTGTQTLTGSTGNDLYSYAAGDGNDRIVDSSGTDTLKLASGINPYNAFFTEASAATDLIITDGTSGDQIAIQTHLSSGTKVENLVFNDGTTIDLTKTVGKSTSNSTVNGTSGADIVIANTNNQTLAGLGGSDGYYFGTGEGQDKINNGVSTTNSAAGTLWFGHGIGDDELWFDRVNDTGTISGSGNNLRIIVMGSTTSMTINGWYIGGSSTYKQLSEFELTDNGLMLDSQLSNLVSAMSTFETNYAAGHGGTAFDPTAVSSITDTTVLSAVSSDWHS